MSRIRAVGLVLLALTPGLLAGCYSYSPITEPAPGSTVRVSVPVRSAVTRPNEEPGTVTVEGLLVSAGDTLLVETRSSREYGAYREVMQLDTLRVAAADVTLIEERLRSQSKTLAFTAIVTVGTVGLALAAINAATGSQGGGKPGDGSGTAGQLRLDPVFSGLLRFLGGG